MSRQRQFKVITFILVAVFCIPLIVLSVRLYDALGPDWSAYDKGVNERNKAFAEKNPFCFTDRDRAVKKPKGIFRIAVIGDSFIWGDGLPYEKVWSHKLEDKLLASYDSVEVLHWGLCGWSTLDEFNFYKQYGKDFDIDLLIIAWVDNDPDIHKTSPLAFTGDSTQYPRLYRLSPRLAKAWNNIRNNDGYDELQDYIYSDANLKEYEAVLTDFHAYMQQDSTPVLCIMTPHAFDRGLKQNFAEGEKLISASGFTYIDLLPEVERKLGSVRQEKLQASPVNSHPGELMTEEFSIEVFNYLVQSHYLDRIPKKK